jgi:uncharacterized membrane protein (UPF0127 family)
MSRNFLLIAYCLIGFLAGCHRDSVEPGAFGLPTAELKVGENVIQTEIANTPQSSETGLMFRPSMPEDHGMLFVFDEPRKATFWMKNTQFPLSIAYIDANHTILEIKSMKPYDETVIPSATNKVAFALEVNEGWFTRHKIVPGTTIQGIPRK